MFQLLLVITYLTLISLGLPDALLGLAWPSMYRELGASVSYADIISMIITGGIIISSLFSNRLIRNFGIGKVTVVSVAITATALFDFSSSHSFLQLCVWTAPHDLGAGSMDAGLNSFVALHYKSRHMSWLHCFWGISATVGPYIMGLCPTRGFKWNSGYMVVGVIQVVPVACLMLSLPLWEVRKDGNSGQDTPRRQATPREGLRLPRTKAVLTAFFCHYALEATAGLWTSSYIVLHRGTAPQIAAKWASFFYLGITLGRLTNGLVTDRLGDRNMVRYGQLTAFAGTMILLLPAGDRAVLTRLIMVGLGYAPVYPSLLHEAPDNFGVQYSQSMMGIQMACAYVGSTFMPPLFRVAAERVGVALYPACLVIFVVSIIGMTERIGRVQSGRVNGLTHAQLLQ